MSDRLHFRVEGRVAVLSIDNPPVNALSQDVCAALAAAVDRAVADPGIDAVVIRAEGRTFPAGADLGELARPCGGTPLSELLTRIEAAPKPVVAAIHGAALGSGFELALACHYRLASEDARVGLPDVTLGLLPAAGGTQRLPRLAGARVALDMMIGGRPLGADAAAEAGILDGVVEGDLDGAAVSFAGSLPEEDLGPRPTSEIRDGFLDPPAYLAAVARERTAAAAAPLEAPRRIVECVEAALVMPFDTGLAFERAALEDLIASPQSAALRHLVIAERRAQHFPDTEMVRPRDIRTLGVAGGGAMGSGIAVALLSADLPVTVLERDDASLEMAVARILDALDGAVARGRMSPEQREERIDRLRGALDPAALADCDLVIEAVPEDLPTKQAVLAALDAALPPGALLATATSGLDVDLLAAGTGRAPDVLGLHFFAPAQVMRLVEVVVGAETAPETVATARALVRRLGKVPVRAEPGDGYIALRVLNACRKAADEMLEDGASVAEIDAALRAFGFPLGPYQMADLTGLAADWSRRKRLAPTLEVDTRDVAILDRLCEAGRFGQETGHGYYAYDEDSATAVEDPEVARIIELERRRKGIVPRRFAQPEITRRCLLAMVNEGARILEAGVAQRPSDIDVAMVHGFAFPRWEGGPMKWADLAGLLMIRRDLLDLVPEDPALWSPADLLTDLVRNGRTFDSLNA